jgi:hypothetical protein
MAASFPGAIKTFSAITRGATKLEQSLFDDPGLEMEAMETELGIGVHGSVGSLTERINLAMDLDGNPRGRIAIFDATDSQRKRIRCGVSHIDLSDGHVVWTNVVIGTINFDPPLQVDCHAFVSIQLNGIDPSLSDIPVLAAYVMDSGTDSKFDYMLTNSSNDPPSDTSSVTLHWVAVEKDFTGTGTDF